MALHLPGKTNIVLQCILSKSWQVTAFLLACSDKQLEGITFGGGCRNELQIFIYSCLYSVCSFMCSGLLPSSKVWALKITRNGGGVKILYKHSKFLGLDLCRFKNKPSTINISQVYFLAGKGAEQKVIVSPRAAVPKPTFRPAVSVLLGENNSIKGTGDSIII